MSHLISPDSDDFESFGADASARHVLRAAGYGTARGTDEIRHNIRAEWVLGRAGERS